MIGGRSLLDAHIAQLEAGAVDLFRRQTAAHILGVGVLSIGTRAIHARPVEGRLLFEEGGTVLDAAATRSASVPPYESLHSRHTPSTALRAYAREEERRR